MAYQNANVQPELFDSIQVVEEEELIGEILGVLGSHWVISVILSEDGQVKVICKDGQVKATVAVEKFEDDELTEEMQESSDSESEIELSVYERRRELNAWRTVLTERLFIEVKKKLYAEKLKQLEKRQAEVLSQEAVDFIKKKEEILKEYHDRLQYIEVIRALRTESLRRRTIGQLDCAQQNLNNNKQMAYERIETDIWTRMRKLDDDMKRCTREYITFCQEFERSKERERRKRKRFPVASVIERLLGDAVSSLMDPYNENVDEDLYVCEQALRAVNGRENQQYQ